MALATCRECRRRVSTEAVACPHCGCPAPVLVLSAAVEPDLSAQIPELPAQPDVPGESGEGIEDESPQDGELGEPATTASLPFPKVWMGFLFVGARVLVDGYVAAQSNGVDLDSQQRMVTATVAFAGLIYWLYCVYALHVVLAIETGFQHPITPNMSVAGHIVPVFNAYWLFKWPNALGHFLEQHRRPCSLARYWIGLILFGSMGLSYFGGAVTTAAWFAVLIYLAGKIREATAPAPSSKWTATAVAVVGVMVTLFASLLIWLPAPHTPAYTAELAALRHSPAPDLNEIIHRHALKVQALHPETLLTPATLCSETELEDAEGRLDEMSLAIEECERDMSSYFAATSDAEPKTREKYQRTFEAERLFISSARDLYAFMRQQLGHCKAEGGRMLFETEAAAAEYNRLLQKLTSLTAQEQGVGSGGKEGTE